MKKILLIALMAVMTVSASAQVEEGFRFGAQVFGGFSTVTGENADNCSSKFAYGAGVIAEYNFNEKLYLGSGLNFQNKGFNEKGIDGSINFLYVTLPIHFGGHIAFNDKLALNIQGGPQLGFGLAGSSIEIYGYDTIDYSDYGKRFEVGLGVKVGVEFSKFQVNLLGNYGLTESTDGGVHNLDFGVGLAYMF